MVSCTIEHLRLGSTYVLHSRYLFVECKYPLKVEDANPSDRIPKAVIHPADNPKYHGKNFAIPSPSYRLNELLGTRRAEVAGQGLDQDDVEVCNASRAY